MEKAIPINAYPFLEGGGEMGQLTRHHDWSGSPLGTPNQWPQSLRVTLSIMLNAHFPMFLWWGPQLTQFYNDAYRPSLGNNGKHPAALGQPGADCWPETWPLIKPLIDQVLAGGEATWSENQLIPIYRNGKMEDVYWTFGYSPVNDESGQVAGVLVICTETTVAVTQHEQLDHRQRQLLSSFEESPVAIAIIAAHQLRFQLANPFYGHLVGRPPQQLIGKTLLEALPELAGQGFEGLLGEVIATGKPFHAPEVAVNVVREGQLETIYVDLTCQPQRDAAAQRGPVTSILVVATDVTQQVLSRRKVEETTAQFRALIQQAPVATCLFRGPQMTIEVANDAMIEVWGKGLSVIGKPLAEALPELQGQPFLPLLDKLFLTGETYQAKGGRADLVVNGLLQTYYFDYSFKPLQDTAGAIYAIMEMAVDVTQEVVARQQLQDSEARFRSIVEQAPMAIGVLRGRDLVIEVGNDRIFDLWGKDPSIRGLPLLVALPELKEQAFISLLEGVYDTGQPYVGTSVPAQLWRQGQLETLYFDFVYTPLRDGDGTITGVMVLAIDVTAQVLAQQAMEEVSSNLQAAIELAQLGTWQMDLITGRMAYSPRLRAWHGIEPGEVVTSQRAARLITPGDLSRLRATMSESIAPGSDGHYDIEYTLEATASSPQRILHSLGQAQFNGAGQAVSIQGTVQDITPQRNLQLTLEQQVQQRTQELAASNEALSRLNQEYALMNQELRESTHLLQRSNDNLQRFAYIASHDLQEPLRKVQQFGDLLKAQYGEGLGEGVAYLTRMQTAAGRMSMLIKDLLTFSQVATRQDRQQPVCLTDLVQLALNDLDLVIAETGAQVTIDALPTVTGDTAQLSQLWLNLLSNALKFRRTDEAGEQVIPQIRMSSHLVAAGDLPAGVKPTRGADRYHQIEVADNGIGFDEKYLDRIFEVFQRLHGKNKFAGTGIGLAICAKVVANHGGAITATSVPGQGATFWVYLPAE